MSYLANDITAPLIQIDSVAIGFQLDGESEARNINSLDLNKDEFLETCTCVHLIKTGLEPEIEFSQQSLETIISF